MRITNVTTETFRWPRKVVISNGKHTYTHSGMRIVKVETDEGTTGVGVCAIQPIIQATIEHVFDRGIASRQCIADHDLVAVGRDVPGDVTLLQCNAELFELRVFCQRIEPFGDERRQLGMILARLHALLTGESTQAEEWMGLPERPQSAEEMGTLLHGFFCGMARG